jgi:hypothetical protein
MYRFTRSVYVLEFDRGGLPYMFLIQQQCPLIFFLGMCSSGNPYCGNILNKNKNKYSKKDCTEPKRNKDKAYTGHRVSWA